MRIVRMIGWCAAPWIALTAAACGGQRPLPVIDPLTDISGYWQLNDQQSDNAAEKIAASGPGVGRDGGGTPQGGGPAIEFRRVYDPVTGT